MDLVRNIFKSPSNQHLKDKENSFKSESPLGALEEQIKLLENINLSPLPSTKEAVMIHKNDVSAILKKIIYNFDIILCDKLRRNRSSDITPKQAQVSQNGNFQNYSQNFQNFSQNFEEIHYWTYISKFFQIPSVKFINNIYEKLQTNNEKGLAWIYISISEKSFFDTVKEIYNQTFDKKFYESESLMQKNKNEILFFSEKICKFHLFSIKLGIEDEYNDYKRQKEMEGKETERSEIDLPILSPINNRKNTSGANLYITPYTLDLKDAKNSNTFYYSKATLDFSLSNLHSKADVYNPEKATKTIDNLFNIINNEDEENMLQLTAENNEEDDLEIIREKSYAKNTQIIYSNVNANKDSTINYANFNLNEERALSTLKMINKNNTNENYNVCKYFDFQSCFKEDFYHNIFESRGGATGQAMLNNTHNINTELVSGEKTDKNLNPPKNNKNGHVIVITKCKDGVINNMGNFNNFNVSNNQTTSQSQHRMSHGMPNFTNLDAFSSQHHTHLNYIPFDKNFRICRKADKNIFSKKDIIYYKSKEIKMTNSVVFYLNHYYKKVPYIRFNTQINTEKPITLGSQNYQCQFCLKKFSTFLFVPLSKVYWCSYYMRYICQDCVSDEFSIIPAFVLKYWNFKKFQISKTARELLDLWYSKPVIHIKQKDPIIKESSALHFAIILKRKIHKIFDLMKCDNHESFVYNTLGEYNYLVLREILFSLKDLVEIQEYKLIKKLKEFLRIFEDHILKDCNLCLYKGGTCMMCMTDEILFAYDVETVFYCNECKKLFHKKCCSFHPCIINR